MKAMKILALWFFIQQAAALVAVCCLVVLAFRAAELQNVCYVNFCGFVIIACLLTVIFLEMKIQSYEEQQ